MEPTVTFSDTQLSMASWNNVMMVYFNGLLQPTHLPAMTSIRAQMAKANPNGIVAIVLIGENATIPPAKIRDEAVSAMTSMRETMRASAYIMRGSGVGVTAIRTLLSAMLLASRQQGSNKIFAQVPEAAGWLFHQGESLLRPKDISAASLESTFSKFLQSAPRAAAVG